MELNDIEFMNQPIQAWGKVVLSPQVTLYYKPYEEEVLGFDFYATLDEYEDGDLKCFYCGNAFYDGVRHLHMGYMGEEESESKGYEYAPVLDDHIAFFNKLKELEKLYCKDTDNDERYTGKKL